MSVIFVFVDGVGLAPAGPDNPLTTAPMPELSALIGGALTLEVARGAHAAPEAAQHPVLLRPIDATLGVPGLPQSGTGQTALLAGVNAAALHGRHQPHFPPTALRPLLAEESIFRRVAERGLRAAFANLFGPGYWEALAARRVRRSASVIAAEGAGLRFRDARDLRAGRAVPWDITGGAMRARGEDAPPLTPHEAGAGLAALACDYELVFFETFLPDLAGHGRLVPDAGPPPSRRPRAADPDAGEGHWPVEAQIHAAMERIDGLVGGALAAMRPADTLLLTSDHGNVESLAAPAHTRNPVPLLAVGAGASDFGAVTDISEVAGAILAAVERRPI